MKIDCMVPRIKLLLIAFIGVLFLASCEKEFSEENGLLPGQQSGTAVFTFDGAPSNCSSAVIGGIYTTATPLTASNTVAVSVNVSTVGSYTVSTAVVNGISFSAAGTFTGTGVQTITLTGTGTPTASGVFNFNTSSSGCGFTIVVIPSGPVAVATLTCAGITSAGVYTQGIALTSTNTISIPVTVTTAGSYFIATVPANGCVFSGAGTLAAGSQTIVLTGVGTPTSAGTTNFSVVLGTSTCSFPITFLPGVVQPSTDFLKCTIDGVAKTFNVNVSGDNTSGVIFIDGDETSASASPSFSIGLSNGLNPANTGVYGTLSLSNLTRICSPSYDDGAGNAWAGALLGQSSGFQVNVTTLSATKVEGTFSGTLYDNSGSGTATKSVTAGSFSITF